MPHAVNDIRIGEAFNHLFRIILKMENSDDDDFIWNFQYTAFVTPFFLLPLMLYRDKCGKNVVARIYRTVLKAIWTLFILKEV